ncbi:response regulator transcription factor [Stackebrandtia nassauensis]|uniref:Two component transcriptional regulator, winged helix family n=1 Tax=Stackebrandtia nassauensis (strain DSM 44728 / CIP 108903 / NRRL B-16338 / NBRC 102104 / LLR-40K-21) TaxID=446470 RepID=D3Q0R2_STANL|nr:response regulator transcription factor [Stackebrandtia nassauensis]ADD41798.1 two component transcriptional regulator, winged helix family [Stackebrandtia nassauensis DSM 44728]
MRLLIVEDEKRLADVVAAGLTAEGYGVDVANDGTTGFSMARQNPYDVIILDIMLPGMNGYQVCRKLREAEVRTPILMLTAKDGEHDEADGLDLGADDYLTKPFSFVVLQARIRALLRRSVSTAPTVWEFGDLVIDPAAKTVRRGEADISLTAKEFAVLEYLASRAGEVVSKTEVLEHVWDFAYDGDVNIVEVYISYLRRKLDAPFGRQAITTLRGAGYRLAADGG